MWFYWDSWVKIKKNKKHGGKNDKESIFYILSKLSNTYKICTYRTGNFTHFER